MEIRCYCLLTINSALHSWILVEWSNFEEIIWIPMEFSIQLKWHPDFTIHSSVEYVDRLCCSFRFWRSVFERIRFNLDFWKLFGGRWALIISESISRLTYIRDYDSMCIIHDLLETNCYHFLCNVEPNLLRMVAFFLHSSNRDQFRWFHWLWYSLFVWRLLHFEHKRTHQ